MRAAWAHQLPCGAMGVPLSQSVTVSATTMAVCTAVIVAAALGAPRLYVESVAKAETDAHDVSDIAHSSRHRSLTAVQSNIRMKQVQFDRDIEHIKADLERAQSERSAISDKLDRLLERQ